MGITVAFNLPTWRLQFPQFGTVSDEAITGLCVPVASVACRNDGGGPVTSAAIQTVLLNLMVAHVCQLNFGTNGNAASPLVGRVSDATEGSVHVAAEMVATQNSQWFLQTPFGAQFWQLTAPYRTMRYIPGRRRAVNPWLARP